MVFVVSPGSLPKVTTPFSNWKARPACLPFALLATVMTFSAPLPSGAYPPLRVRDLAGILLCMVFARSAAMAFNRLADRKIDADNPRTAQRHLPSGELSVWSVVLFTIVSSLIFVAGTCFFLPNYLPLAVSLPVLGVLFGYSYTKRFTFLCHFALGLGLSLAPIGAYLAAGGGFDRSTEAIGGAGYFC